MPEPAEVLEESHSLERELRIDAVCQVFEGAWKAVAEGGTRPRIEDHIAAVAESERWPLLRELLKLEFHYRRHEFTSPDEFRRRFSEYGHLLAPILDQLLQAVADNADLTPGKEAGHDPFSTADEIPQADSD